MSETLMLTMNDRSLDFDFEQNASLPAIRRHTIHNAINLAHFQCGRCMSIIEVAVEQLPAGRRIRCSRCHRSLRAPSSIKQICLQCGTLREYSPDCSGRHVQCKQCGLSVSIPVHTLQPTRRRRRRLRTTPQESSFLPMLITLCVFLIGILLCYRIVSTL